MLDDFMVKMFHGFPKPQNKFIRDMVYGIQATGDTIITDIARAVAPEDKHRNVENRLSRNLQAEGLHEKIRDAIQADLRFRAHPRHVLRKLEEHVRDRPRDDLLHRRVARSRREEGRPRRAQRAHAPEIQRDAGVLPRCARCRNQAGVRALRKLGDESRGQEEGRQTYPPPKASRRDWLQGVPTLPGWDELSYLGVG